MICEPCKSGTRATKEGWNTNTRCYGSFTLSQQQDFLDQKEWLTEVAELAGMSVIFYPKYHCELNYIENVWGWLKSYHRRHCTYNYAHLKTNLPLTIQDMPLAFIRRAARSCFRFMSAYRVGLKGPILDYAMRVYTSHRRILGGDVGEIQERFDEKQSAKRVKL